MKSLLKLLALTACLCSAASEVSADTTRQVRQSYSGGSGLSQQITIKNTAAPANSPSNINDAAVDNSRAMLKVEAPKTENTQHTRTVRRSISGGSGMADQIVIKD